jgi:hypothetical protein
MSKVQKKSKINNLSNGPKKNRSKDNFLRHLEIGKLFNFTPPADLYQYTEHCIHTLTHIHSLGMTITFLYVDKKFPLPGTIAEPGVVVPMVNENCETLSEEEKVEKLVGDLKKAYKKNQSMAKANKSLRLQLHQACKKTLSQKSKHEVVRDVMAVSTYEMI